MFVAAVAAVAGAADATTPFSRSYNAFRRGAVFDQFSSARCKIGAIADARTARVRSRLTTISVPSRPPSFKDPSFIRSSVVVVWLCAFAQRGFPMPVRDDRRCRFPLRVGVSIPLHRDELDCADYHHEHQRRYQPERQSAAQPQIHRVRTFTRACAGRRRDSDQAAGDRFHTALRSSARSRHAAAPSSDAAAPATRPAATIRGARSRRARHRGC